jgi:hypothetical protein
MKLEYRVLVLLCSLASAFAQNFATPPAQTCTAASINGTPIAGNVCGGSTHGLGCTAGALYNCKSGAQGTQNNCTLLTACATGCITTGSPNPLNDACFTGTFHPITVTPLNTLGGNDLSVTLELDNPHPGGAYVNLKIDRGDLVPGSYCAPPFELDGTLNTATFGLSSAVVTAPTPVHIYSDLAYTDASGVSHELASTPQTVTLNPGGSEPPPPPLDSFSMSPSSIGPGGSSLVVATLSRMAPASGVQVTLTSDKPSVASIIANGQPFILGSCLSSAGAFAIQAANSVAATTTVNIGASSGAAGQAPITQPLTVTGGCVPISCSGGPSCGATPDGCGGTLNCGCTNLPNQTCGGGGTPGQCGPPVLAVSGISMSPTSVVAGNSSTGTVTLNMAAPTGGALVGISSTSSFVTVPGTITIPAGQTSGTFTASTTVFTAGSVSAQISAAKATTVSTILTVTAAPAPPPPTSAALSLTASGRSGETIVSTPAGLNVAVGSTGSASFPVGTSITLKDPSGRTVIWSGICSSGGSATRQCTFTLQANSSETGKVQ